MSKMEGGTVCVICCGPFTRTRTEREFVRVLKLSQCSPFKDLETSGVWRKYEKALGERVCSKCQGSLSSVLESKEKVTRTEKELRELQIQILRLKRSVVQMAGELECAITVFQMEAGELEGILEESKGKLQALDKYLSGGDNDGKALTLRDANKLRKRLFAVISEEVGAGTNPGRRSEKGQHRFRDRTVKPGASKQLKLETEKAPVDPLAEAVLPEEYYASEILVKAEPGADHDSEDPTEMFAQSPSPPPAEPEAVKNVRNEDNGESKDDEDDSDEEFVPRKYPKGQKKRMEAEDLLNRLGIDPSTTSPFKTAMIVKFYKLGNRMQKELAMDKVRDTYGFSDIDPVQQHPISYDPQLDKVVISGVHFSINSDENCLDCTACGAKIKGAVSQFPQKIFDHVLGPTHLDLFRCPLCDSKLSKHQLFKTHFQGHGGKFTCDNCGKPLKGVRSLEKHKWTHMSQEEKEEAVKNGFKPPQSSYRQLRAKKKDFQCAACGKGGFPALSYLRKHEEIHKDPQFMCPQCGKGCHSQSHLKYHQKYACVLQPPEERESLKPFWCATCLKRFPNESTLRVHKLTHGDLRAFKCGWCDKIFKTKSNLRQHERQHKDWEPLPCRKGCGALYREKRYLIPHEKKCQFN